MPMKESTEPKDLIEFVEQSEMQDILDEWDRYDKNQDGTVTKAEFLAGERAWHKELNGGEDITDEELEEKLTFWKRTKDGNNDGEVGYYEFANAKALLILDAKDELHLCLSKAEVADAQQAFNYIDKDLSGGICESEARTYYREKFEREVQNNLRTRRDAMQAEEAAVKRLFFTHNPDGDALITFDEFLREEAKSIIADRLRGDNTKESMVADVPVPEQAEEVGEMAQVLTQVQIDHAKIKFDEIDVDQSGGIEMKELKKVFKTLGLDMKQTKFNKELKMAFKKADTDGDAKLDFEEFKSIYNYLYLKKLDMSVFC